MNQNQQVGKEEQETKWHNFFNKDLGSCTAWRSFREGV
jgi:hypothetical protein